MTFCTLHLAQGRTMIGTTKKSGTIKNYLIASSSVSLNCQQLDLLLNEHGQDTQCIKNILSDVKRWESIPNLIEPITVKITVYMLKKCDGKHPDSIDLLLCD